MQVLLCEIQSIVTRVGVIIDGVWICEWIY
jgi:hypothetical protein